MTTDHTIIPLDNNTELLLLDDEDDLRDLASIDREHQFLNFSRKIAESVSMKRPVDIQLGIAFGRDLLFSRSLLDKKPPFQLSTDKSTNTLLLQYNDNTDINPCEINNEKDEEKTKVENLLLKGKKSLPPLPPMMQDDDGHKKIISNKKPFETKDTLHHGSKALVEMRMNPSKKNLSGLLDRLVADVLKHIESCPGQSAYSVDLDRLKPKLEAYKMAKPKV